MAMIDWVTDWLMTDDDYDDDNESTLTWHKS